MGVIVRTSAGTASDEKRHIPRQRVGGIVRSERQEVQLEADTSHQHTLLSCYGRNREGGVRSQVDFARLYVRRLFHKSPARS